MLGIGLSDIAEVDVYMCNNQSAHLQKMALEAAKSRLSHVGLGAEEAERGE